jgi:hypothetical protein
LPDSEASGVMLDGLNELLYCDPDADVILDLQR